MIKWTFYTLFILNTIHGSHGYSLKFSIPWGPESQTLLPPFKIGIEYFSSEKHGFIIGADIGIFLIGYGYNLGAYLGYKYKSIQIEEKVNYATYWYGLTHSPKLSFERYGLFGNFGPVFPLVQNPKLTFSENHYLRNQVPTERYPEKYWIRYKETFFHLDLGLYNSSNETYWYE